VPWLRRITTEKKEKAAHGDGLSGSPPGGRDKVPDIHELDRTLCGRLYKIEQRGAFCIALPSLPQAPHANTCMHTTIPLDTGSPIQQTRPNSGFCPSDIPSAWSAFPISCRSSSWPGCWTTARPPADNGRTGRC